MRTLEDCLAAIAGRDDGLGAYIWHDAAVVRAEAAQRRGPLAGLGFAVKDTIDVAGWPTEANCRLHRGRRATRDAAVVAMLRRLGAVPLGKVSTWELGAGTGERQECALAPPPRHPLDPRAFVGGSSSGSAVAVAAGMAHLALGGDTGGSVRCPAAACGVFGLKPSFGLLPLDGVLGHSRDLDHLGLIAAEAALLRRVLRALVPEAARQPPARPRVAIIADWGSGLSPAIAAAMARAAARLRGAGAALIEVEPPISIPAARDLVRRIGLPDSVEAHRDVLAAPPGLVSEGLRDWLLPGLVADPAGRAAALAARAALRERVEAILGDADALLCPGETQELPDAEDDAANVAYCLASGYCVFNLTGHPAVSVPAGLGMTGRPLGLQLVARRGDDDALLALAALIAEPVSLG